jgi:hypothetical protein
MSEAMAGAINANTGEMDGDSFSAFLDDQAEQWGEPDVGEEVLDLDIDEGDDEEEDEEDGEEGLAEDEEEDEEEEGSEERRLSTDEVIAHLEQVDGSGEAASLVRGMRAKMMQNINEFNTLKGEMLDIREEMLNMRGGNAEPAPSTEGEETAVRKLPQGITQENIDVFKDIATHLGWKGPEEQAAEDASTSANQFSLAQAKAAVEEFGESFGALDEDGSVVINPEVQAALNKKLEELQDPSKGVTPRDLFLMLNPGAGGQSRRNSRGRQRGGRRPAARNERPTRGNVLRRTTSRSGSVKVRSEKGNDDPGDVFDRCFNKAKFQLTAP